MKFFAVVILCLVSALPAPACELCAIYSASNARGESSSGFLFTLSEQYTAQDTLQFEGHHSRNSLLRSAFLDSSITHIVPGYNFSPRFGLSINLPYVYREFRRTELSLGSPFAPLPPLRFVNERGSIHGVGDTALVGRGTIFQKSAMTYSVILNVLAGIKFPTGDTARLEDEVAQERLLQQWYGLRHNHAFGGVHQHDLTLGTGSYDGVFGVTGNFRSQRFFLSLQAQYYLRSEALEYQIGDLTIVSGGPGVYALLLDRCTLSVQANVFYENQNSDLALGQVNNQTGFTAWYMGPQLSFTWGEHFSANAAVDLPLRIYNHGYQSVLDYRIRAGMSWKF